MAQAAINPNGGCIDYRESVLLRQRTTKTIRQQPATTGHHESALTKPRARLITGRDGIMAMMGQSIQDSVFMTKHPMAERPIFYRAALYGTAIRLPVEEFEADNEALVPGADPARRGRAFGAFRESQYARHKRG